MRCKDRFSDGKVTDNVESRIFCDKFIELESVSPIDGKFLE